jgi:hypothetical protein
VGSFWEVEGIESSARLRNDHTVNAVRSARTIRRLRAVVVPLAAVAACVAGASATGAVATRSEARPPSLLSGSASEPLSGHYRVLFLLCDFTNWRYEPNAISFYQRLWTSQHSLGARSSLADYFRDESYGKMDMKGSTVRGWYHIALGEKAWYQGGNGNRLGVRWLSCVNAALAHGLGVSISAYRAVVAVTPSVQSTIAGSGLAAQPALLAGQRRPASEQVTVSSTKNWPPAPFLMSLPPDSLSAYGENVLVSRASGKTLTLTRGYNEGQTQLRGPFPAIAPGGTVVPDTDDDFAYVGPVGLYLQTGGQRCSSGKGLCPSISTSKLAVNRKLAITNTPVSVGVANLFAGQGTLSAGVGDSAHEVGHTTGYNHSRALSSSTTDYNDCYDQMSYSCGLPGIRGVAGPPDGVFGLDAIDLEFHGWIPRRLQYNTAADHSFSQKTLTLHALSDPHALAVHGQFLDVHIPARFRIEDVSPTPRGGGVPLAPTIPPTCTKTGYHCGTSQYYTLEYRQLYGFDASLRLLDNQGFGGAPPVGMVALHLYAPDAGNGSGNISYLVDRNPTTGSFLPHQAGLQPGDDYADPAHHTYVAVNQFNAKTLTARVTVSSSPIDATLTIPTGQRGVSGRATALRARLTVGGAPVPDQPISLSLGPGQGCGPVLTNATGVAACAVTLDTAIGTRPFQAYFAGDPGYRPIVAYSTFSVSLS